MTTVMFNESTYRVEESSGTIQLTLVLTDPLSTDVTIQVIDDTAIVSEPLIATNREEDEDKKDYIIDTYSVTFTAGMTTASVDVPVIDDSISENNENFDIVIDQSSLPNRVSVGNPDQVTVTILDDDGM